MIEESIEALPNFDWDKCVNSAQITTEYGYMMDIVSEHILELKKNAPNNEIVGELDRLKKLFYDYSTLTKYPSEQEKAMQIMKEIVNNLKDCYPA